MWGGGSERESLRHITGDIKHTMCMYHKSTLFMEVDSNRGD